MRFGHSAERRKILRGFLAHRRALRALGVTNGKQWIDGSFVEERTMPPRDIDVVTFCQLPKHQVTLMKAHPEVFTPKLSKKHYLCDAYFVDYGDPPDAIVGQTHYWYGLFSHRRGTSEWKGMLEVSLENPFDEIGADLVIRRLEGSTT